MGVLRTILTIIFILVCVALTVIVLMQEGKSEGLGAISGAAETYWGKTKDVPWKVSWLRLPSGLQLDLC